jgi:ATP synthase protein I
MQGRDQADAWRSANQAWDVIGLLLSGILVCGGIGWVLDRLVGFERHVFVPIGMLAGMGLAIYLIYLKLGRLSDPHPTATPEKGSRDEPSA